MGVSARAAALVLAAGTLAAGTLVAGCDSSTPGGGEADRLVATVLSAVAYPRQADVGGYLRALAATRASRDGRLTVVRAEARTAPKLEDPFAFVVLRVNLPTTHDGSVETPPASPGLVTCYEVLFGFYGAVGGARRVDCVEGETGAVPVPSPSPVASIPPGFDKTLADVVRRAPAGASAEVVKHAVEDAVGKVTNGGLRPSVDVAKDGDAVGVGVSAPAAGECLFAVRRGASVDVWAPSRKVVAPGEATCDGHSALAGVNLP